jgi:hypothetical protein
LHACRSTLEDPRIAPQHGAMIYKKEHIQRFFNWLSNLRCGVDIVDEFYK